MIYLTAFLFRLALAFLPGLSWDIASVVAWSTALASKGPWTFYGSMWCDYLPGYLHVLWLVGLVHKLVSPSAAAPALTYLVKMPPVLADLALAWLLTRWVREIRPPREARRTGVLFLWNPAIWIVSAVWGQADSVLALFFLAAAYFLSKPGRACFAGAALLGLAVVTKPQALILAPLVALWSLRRHSVRTCCLLLLTSLGTFMVVILPFWGKQPADWILRQYMATANQYQATSANAFNLWALAGMWRADSVKLLGLTMLRWGFVVFGICYAWILWRLWRTGASRFLEAGVLVVLGSFLFLTRMHERYAYTALPLLLLAWAATRHKLWLNLYAVLSATFTVGLLYTLYYYAPKMGAGPFALPPAVAAAIEGPIGRAVIKGLSLANLAIWALAVGAFARPIPEPSPRAPAPRPTAPGPTKKKGPPEPAVALLRSKDYAVAVALFVLALALYLPRLGHPSTEYFDEVHHVKTGKQFLKLKDISEWSHPHLGKLAMAASMAIFGQNAFAWRLPQVIVGSGSIALLYVLGLTLFRSRAVGLAAALLMFFDGLQFTISRIGMLDAHIAFYALLAYVFVSRWFFPEWKPTNHAFAALGLALGLAIASKWIGIYTAASVLYLLGVAFFQKRVRYANPSFDASVEATFLRAFAFLALLPALVYLASYFRFVQIGHGLAEVLRNQRDMWSYHAGIKETHPYTSPWWTWPFLIRPVCVHYQGVPDTQLVEGIVFLGNPAIFWVAVPAIAYLAWKAFDRANAACFFVLVAFCFQYLPWALSPRKLVFFHHFYSALPFLALAVAQALADLWSKRSLRPLVVLYGVLVIGLFVYFYPVLSAWRMPTQGYMGRMWFPRWI